MADRLEIDPSRCWIRHIRRTTTGGVQILGTTRFAAAALEGVNGDQGWISATPERRLSDDGSMTITFPNATGEDGTPHVDRFALLTDPAYRVGEEWLELYREPGTPGDLLFVGTPVEWDLSPAALTLTCADALVLLANQRATEVDYWTGAAPRDVFEHYTQAKAFVVGQEFGATLELPAGWTVEYSNDGSVDRTAHPGGPWTPDPAGGIRISTPPVSFGVSRLTAPAPTLNAAADWEAEARIRLIAPGYVTLLVGSPHGLDATYGGTYLIMATNGTEAYVWIAGDVQGGGAVMDPFTFPDTGAVTLRLVARGEFVHAFVNGELRQTRRRAAPAATGTAPALAVGAEFGGAITIESMHLLELKPFLMRGAEPGELRLPGVPPPGGLQGAYYDEIAAHTLAATKPAPATAFPGYALMPDLEPSGTRLDATIDFGWTPTTPPWQIQGGISGTSWYSVRWTGAIYLDLEAADREVQIDAGDDGRSRVWIAGIELATTAGTTSAVTTGSLRAHFGALAGWYPIRFEYVHTTGAAGAAQLAEGPLGGPYPVVPAERLSPLGTFSQAVRYDSHRELLGQIAEAFGYQWRLEPRSLESGTFPGEIVPRMRVGVDTDVVVDDLDGQEIHSTGTAADAIDGLLIDASGLANPDPDAPSLTAEFLLAEIARDHLVVHQAYESLAEISEATMLQTRGTSLLALRSSPAETIAARPTGGRGLARIMQQNTEPGPLQFTGELARMRWEPGDGVRLDLPGIRARDLTPRQLTSVAWPCRPDGIGPPTVAFRQRPRGMRAVLARALRVALTTARARGRR